jgi:AraC-like DNA-binding protein
MGLTRHQASELLNERMGMNFTAFINGFRIEAAKKLLASRPEMTVLSVALEVGFGNKTSFNEAFKRIVGRTPREYKNTIEAG